MCAGKNDGPERGGEEEGGGDGDRDKEDAWRGGWHAKTLLFRQLRHQSERQPKCPALKKKRKQALHFPKFAVSKRRLHMEEEVEVDRVGLKKLKEDSLEEEMEQLDILLTNMLSSNTK